MEGARQLEQEGADAITIADCQSAAQEVQPAGPPSFRGNLGSKLLPAYDLPATAM